jgi:hypothetical protein
MIDHVALVEKVVDEVITLAPPLPPDKHTGHRMVQRSMDSAALVTKNRGLSLQDLPWMIT